MKHISRIELERFIHCEKQSAHLSKYSRIRVLCFSNSIAQFNAQSRDWDRITSPKIRLYISIINGRQTQYSLQWPIRLWRGFLATLLKSQAPSSRHWIEWSQHYSDKIYAQSISLLFKPQITSRQQTAYLVMETEDRRWCRIHGCDCGCLPSSAGISPSIPIVGLGRYWTWALLYHLVRACIFSYWCCRE